MKEKKIKQIKTHVGGLLAGGDITIQATKHNAEMELAPMGVLVKCGGRQVLVPYTNITHVEFEADQVPVKK